MPMTLLEIVQDIANDLETDWIDSINDTTEAIQIANIVKSTYFELMANRNWPHLRRKGKMELGPTKVGLSLPVDCKELVSLSYDCGDKSSDPQDYKRQQKFLLYVTPEEFLYRTRQRDSTATNVEVEASIQDDVEILIRNDKDPEYFTSFEDRFVFLDSYNSHKGDLSIGAFDTQATYYINPSWTHLDGAIPDLPDEAFPLLVEEAKATASYVIKQQANPKAEQKAARQNRWLSRKAWRVAGGVQYPNYGRKKHSSVHQTNPMFNKDFKA